MHWTDPRAWPGKARPYQGSYPWHPAAFHMFDVAACAELLLVQQAGRMMRLAELVGVEANALRSVLVALVALHDLGKFSPSFIARIGSHELEGLPPDGTDAEMSHWQATDVLLNGLDPLLAPVIGGDQLARATLYASVAGHHGRPPRNIGRTAARVVMRSPGGQVAADFVKTVVDRLGPEPLPAMDLTKAKTLSWLLAGLTTLADWIGSNPTWFPYTDPHGTGLAEYWLIARGRSEDAIRQAGAKGARAAPYRNADALLTLPSLRPMQIAADTVALPDGPALIVLEDSTGAGKTEAALVLVQRLMASGRASGLYAALPTMATANAMFDRLAGFVRRFYDEPPSLALAHGRRALHDGFRAAVRGGADAAPEPDAAGCAAWIADDRRKAFLAEIGVGTIDQALQAVLPVRFGTLRLWGLADRVLIVDEVHAYDAYIKEELKTLLKFQAQLGGSAIVMTATLPTAFREALVTAYVEGLGTPVPVPKPAGYPSLTVASRSGVAETVVTPAAHTVRRVQVERLDSRVAARDAVIEAAKAGAAVAWVRNAVDDAIQAVQELEDAGVPADLFHARFAMGDRLRIESDVVRRFGITGEDRDRRGRVVVATQVIEQSLDLDFDFMVSDLAPVDLLIQRAGRLWRHMDRRPASARPRPNPLLAVLAPDPSDVVDERWLHQVLDRGAYVYDVDVQWRSAAEIFGAGTIDAPDGLRPLIEAVYGAAKPVPPALRRAALDAEGATEADAALGRLNVLDVDGGYGGAEKYHDDAEYPTRLGEAQRILALARRTDKGIQSWAADMADDDEHRWALSEVAVSLKRLAPFESAFPDNDLMIEEAIAGWPDWRKRTVRIVTVAPDGGIVPGLRYDARWGLLID